ncbi:hypothetical protein SELMODRAFT_411349 [Selaginella moellendorffii]|uniref:Uncharacterized protein n=1 Tax=Selaginella moellendorffii TaxID=88036 RepID=D8RHC9_SELML|nr:hypothetical protein SELMODRAFT_411349 [Selaginella moellendorffii]
MAWQGRLERQRQDTDRIFNLSSSSSTNSACPFCRRVRETRSLCRVVSVPQRISSPLCVCEIVWRKRAASISLGSKHRRVNVREPVFEHFSHWLGADNNTSRARDVTFARLVREALCDLELPYTGKGSLNCSKLKQISGSTQVPLVDPNTGIQIVRYLFANYNSNRC